MNDVRDGALASGKRRLAGAIISVFVFSAMACDSRSRYEFQRGCDGKTLRLDRTSGRVSAIENGMVTPLLERQPEQEASAKPKAWPSVAIPGDSIATVSTVWRDGRLYYRIVATPNQRLDAGVRRPMGKRFVISLIDANRFTVIRIDVDFAHDLIRNEGPDGQTATYSASSWVECPRTVLEIARECDVTANY
jgi:hypothetical protein